MTATAAIGERERRKHVRVRLRRNLVFSTEQQAGGACHVVRDPLTLRHYRLDDRQRFLVDLMDGNRTLDEIRAEYERRWRPDRLPPEQLEVFAAQLVRDGLALCDSPLAGEALVEAARRRRHAARWSAVLNVLAIRLPLCNPDRFLGHLLPWVRFAFTAPFLLCGAGLMVAALALVTIRWADFTVRLPDARAFFTLTNLLYLWVAVGLVKVLHELAHGLCCKAHGGSVHEMGVLLLVFCPTLYCDVTASWTIHGKWRRIAVSAAGIYVELLVAAAATFGWWATAPATAVNHLCLALMVVCSANTVLLNGNPLLHYDGYHVLADWLEVPNLHETAGRLLEARLLRLFGVGVPLPPRTPGAGERFLLGYALASYAYRWVVLLCCLGVVHAWLGPRKLGSVASAISVVAVAGLLLPPFHRLARAVHRRGRLPDMNPVRFWLSFGVVAVLAAVVAAVPLPMSVGGVALVQVEPDQMQKVTVPEPGGFLRELAVRDGQRVRAGDVLAVLVNPDLEIKLRVNEADQALRQGQKSALLAEVAAAGTGADPAAASLQETEYELRGLVQQRATLLDQRDRLVLRAPCDGTVMRLLSPDERGKWLDRNAEVCRIGHEHSLRAILVVESADRDLIAPGSRAWVRIHGGGSNRWAGVVAEVAQVDAASIPPQLSSRAGGDVATRQDPVSQAEKPYRPHYLCSVRLYRGDNSIHPGVLGRVRIEAGSQTLWWRLRRYLAATLN